MQFFDGVLNKMGGLQGVDYSKFSDKLTVSEFGEALGDAEAALRKFGQDPENMQVTDPVISSPFSFQASTVTPRYTTVIRQK